MKYPFRQVVLLLCLFIIIPAIAACSFGTTNDRESAESIEETENLHFEESMGQSLLEVHFIDVGQGDATLIKCGEHNMLIDAGPDFMGTKLQLYLMKQGIKELDYLVLTHPDSDHIGGGDVIVTKYDIGTVFMGDFKKEGTTYEELINALAYKNEKPVFPRVGSIYPLGEAEFVVLAPNQSYEDANNSSIALLLKHGENAILFTGDCKAEAESDIMSNGLNIDCDVYKVAHHGSGSSSSIEFLEAVSPQVAVISCGENDYGHPHEEVLDNLQKLDATVYRTDEQGDIVACSDGVKLTWTVASDKSSQNEEKEMAGGATEARVEYIIANKKSGVFHKSSCTGLPAEGNRILFEEREDAMEAGFTNPCNYCRP